MDATDRAPLRVEETCFADDALFLLADESLVETSSGAVYRLCRMQKEPEPVLRPVEPWEGGGRPVHQDPLTGSVLHDPYSGQFHCWYRSHNVELANLNARPGPTAAGGRGSWNCYATSADGIDWRKPNLGLVPFGGDARNNMLPDTYGPVSLRQMDSVVPNHLAEPDASVIGGIFGKYDDRVYPSGITWAGSRDGLSWVPHFPPVLPLDGDAHCIMWDWRDGCYICTTRAAVHRQEFNRLRRVHGIEPPPLKRHVALARSRDLIHWTPMMPVLEADAQDPERMEIYFMYILPYGHGYLGFLQTFVPDLTMTYGPLEMQLAFSRDLMNWARVGDRQPILPRGDAGEWDSAHVSLFHGAPYTDGMRLRFWYGGKDTEHWQTSHAAMGSATLRRDGFACYESGDDEGVITTVPLQMTWATKPCVSADAAGGEIRVEILNARTGEPIDGCRREACQPITGNGTKMLVNYGGTRGNFIRHAGPVRFRFHLRRAKLYAFQAPNCSLSMPDASGANDWL